MKVYQSHITYKAPQMCGYCLHGGDARSPQCSCPDPVADDIEEHSNKDLFGQIEVVVPNGFAKNEDEVEVMEKELNTIFCEPELIYITEAAIQGIALKIAPCTAEAHFDSFVLIERKNIIRREVMKWFDTRPMKEYLAKKKVA